MSSTEATLRAMPDIANEEQPNISGQLDWVGMGEIEVPVNLAVEGGVAPQASARVRAYVNLNEANVRGIHMSRLYLHVDQHLSNEPLTPSSLRQVLDSFLASHEDLSDRAYLRIDFDYLVRRPALRSDNSGWRRYPVRVAGALGPDGFDLEITCDITYSSTCPCSAALARQIIQQQFKKDFDANTALDYQKVLTWLGSEQGICATPHSQRSIAELRLRLSDQFDLFPFLELIDRIENALSTPVQSAVKREDEQAFAELNGQNLMFCEDAARRIQAALNEEPGFIDFWARASHFESLHPHDAVAVTTKGIPNGYHA